MTKEEVGYGYIVTLDDMTIGGFGNVGKGGGGNRVLMNLGPETNKIYYRNRFIK